MKRGGRGGRGASKRKRGPAESEAGDDDDEGPAPQRLRHGTRIAPPTDEEPVAGPSRARDPTADAPTRNSNSGLLGRVELDFDDGREHFSDMLEELENRVLENGRELARAVRSLRGEHARWCIRMGRDLAELRGRYEQDARERGMQDKNQGRED